MNYEMTNPCANCPFRKDIPPFLNYGRVIEIGKSLIRGEFPCHKTTVMGEGEDADLEATKDSQHCAGALILMEKTGQSSQMMRIVERLGMYDHSKLNMDAPVFDSWQEMADAQPKRSRRKS